MATRPSRNIDATDRGPASPGTLSQTLQQRLLEAASAMCGELKIAGLIPKVRAALACLPEVWRGGLGVYDQERGILAQYIFAPSEAVRPSACADDTISQYEQQIADADIAALRALQSDVVTGDAPREGCPLFWDRWREAGVRRLASAPLLLQDRFLGAVFAGFKSVEPAPEELGAFLTQLGRIVTPVLWNCQTHARFLHGDRRRDALIELSNAINTSLKLQTVLDSARQAIRTLEGHCFSAIGLLEDDGRSYRSYRTVSSGPGGSAEHDDARTEPVASTVMEWVLEQGQTYHSDDLARHLRFEHDAELRDLGVRRYVATPLFVRARVIGCLLLGSTDPGRVLGVDVWLYENIALQLALAIDNARQLEQVQRLSERLGQQNVYLREEIQSEHDYGEMIGQSAAMVRVREAIARVAPTDSIVLICGETGVGKELVARAIHAGSPRAEQPMVKVNCAAIPEGMVESELFGHERGAFTSAVERRVGRFELARDGTLFLDEIAELSLPVQAKLLRVLQDGQFERVGGTRTLTSNARIITATNRDLLNCVESGSFRSDLYYRLNVFPIEVPTLRDRREDIPLLIEAFVKQFSRRMGKRVEAIAPHTLTCLCQRNWPGNIRELRHEIERAMILQDDPVLRVDCRAPAQAEPAHLPTRSQQAAFQTLEEAEAEHIRNALAETAGVIEGPRGAAQLLGMKPSTLRFRMKRLGIARSS